MSPPVCMSCLQRGAADLMYPACLLPWMEMRQADGQTGRQLAGAIGLTRGSNCILRKAEKAQKDKLKVTSK